MPHRVLRAVLTAILLIVPALVTAAPALLPSGRAALDSLLAPAAQAELLDLLAAVEPPERLRRLAAYGPAQATHGAGFFGLMPDQLADADRIPLPNGPAGLGAAAVHLARQRRANLDALARLNPDYPLTFRGAPLAVFLDTLTGAPAPDPDADADARPIRIALDVSAVAGFFAAAADGRITGAEAADLAVLPANTAMLRHRRELGYVPEPLPGVADLAAMITLAGSPDPLDRLWCWLSPWNAFDYADLAENPDGYATFLADLDRQADALTAAVRARVLPATPHGARLDFTYGLTVGWAIRGWVTPEMAGLNVEQVKDDWRLLFGTMVEETYHRLQLEFMPTADGGRAADFEALLAADTGAPRWDAFYQVLAATVAEGAANHVRGPCADPGLAARAPAGAELLDRFVQQVVLGGDVAAADGLLNEGLQGNGPLYGLGWRLAGLIAAAEGEAGLGAWQARGPVACVRRGAELARARGEVLVSPAVAAATDTLAHRLAGRQR